MYHHIPPYFHDGFEESKEFDYKNSQALAPMSSTPDQLLNGRLRQNVNYYTPRTVAPSPNPTTIINNNHINFYSSPGTVLGNSNQAASHDASVYQ